ncbi:MAG: translation initiation factor IF-1 [Parcubacteria group bacterium]|nr:translation initiation factor IF-1 [Parcubacteria group bacterium]
MSKKQLAQAPAEIIQRLHGMKFKVKFENGYTVNVGLAGKIRTMHGKNNFAVGDKVIVECHTDTSKIDNGRIIERKK